jgi:simple sugar transport system substrate-binding protein
MSDAVPADVQQLVLERKQQIIDGSLHPFAGPVKNQAGEVVVAEGQVMADKDMLSMNFYVQGVEGELPK